MHRRLARIIGVGVALAQVTPALAQTGYPSQPDRPTTRPALDRPQVQPPRPRPEIQPPRPGPRPPVVVRPPRPRPPVVVQPPRPPIVQPGYGRNIRCESFGNRQQRCAADTRGGVTLVRRLGGNCRQGHSWGYDQRSVFVSRGCRAEFRTGYSNGGGGYPQPDRDRGPSTGVVIAGVAVAGGLLALLASNASKKKAAAAAAADAPPPTYPAGPPAALSADLAAVPAAARPVVQNCLFDAARQIGVTGGTRVAFDRAESLETGNGGYRLRTTLVATYPDGERDVPMFCRATPTKIVELSFG